MCENAENKEQQLNEIFERIGEENGMRATAEFAAFTDLKVKWVRTSDWAEFRVSDYLRDAPEGSSRTWRGRSWRGSADAEVTTPTGRRPG